MSLQPGTLARAAAIGATAGLRSQLPLALLARSAGDTGERIFRRKFVRVGLYASALNEAVIDKLPVVPNRIDPGPLAGRVVLGALSGAILVRRSGGNLVTGVIAGAGGAFAGTCAGYYSRTWLGTTTGIPDPFWALVEDGVAQTVGSLVVRR